MVQLAATPRPAGAGEGREAGGETETAEEEAAAALTERQEAQEDAGTTGPCHARDRPQALARAEEPCRALDPTQPWRGEAA